MKLPPYNAKAKCEKCGCPKVRVYYAAAGDRILSRAEEVACGYDTWPKFERMVRTCDRCNYVWIEEPKKPRAARRSER